MARRLQRQQVRLARRLRGAALRPAPLRHQGQPDLSGRRRYRPGADAGDSWHRHAASESAGAACAVPPPCGDAGARRRRDPARRAPGRLSRVHLAGYPHRLLVPVQAAAVLRAGDALSQRPPLCAGRKGRCAGGGAGRAAVKRGRLCIAAWLAALLLAGCGTSAPPATGGHSGSASPQVTQDVRFTASDGITLRVKIGGRGALAPRPLIVEFSPYDPGCCAEYAGPDYNYLQVHIRGTGDSDGGFDALGARSQQDVVEVLDWACRQPWSNGTAGVYGFSASAIMIYNALHLRLPSCVKSAVLMAGTHELYRDLLYPGGIPNIAAGTFVLVGIGGPAASESFSRLQRNPLESVLPTTLAMFDVGLEYLQHPTLDDWWQERGTRGDVNHLPILMITSFYDVEPRGPFQAFQQLRSDGAHLFVYGAHDGAPAGTEDARYNEQSAWYDHYLRGIDNRVEQHPRVQMLLSDGDRLDYLAGKFLAYDSSDWPVPGTRWQALALDPARSGTAQSINDGSLTLGAPAASAMQSYPEIASLPTETDPHTTGVVGAMTFGSYSFNTLMTAIPQLADMTLMEPLSLSYTSAPLTQDVMSAGPVSLEITLSSSAPETDVYAVMADVSPDGRAHPVATGRLRSAYPDVDPERSLKDADGDIVQPYGVYAAKNDAAPLAARPYRVEFWPIGNRFRKGHRLRLYLVGVSAYHLPALPGVVNVSVGANSGARLLLPVLPGSALQLN
ncbi:MAG: CocE/NonD family hydrolase [Nevskiaceae bacterium]|nr:MAG: CocE/NonD family hydrolase [Nevskiaceae bacterium]